MKTTNQLTQKLKGYHRNFKGRFLLLRNGVLTEGEYILWDLSFSILADWDKKNHSDNYGTFSYTQEEIGSFLGWHKTKVCRLSKKLFQKSFWVKRPDNRIVVVGFDIIENLAEITKERGIVDLQEYILKTQSNGTKMKQRIENLQPNTPKENSIIRAQEVAKIQPFVPKKPLVSSNDRFSVLKTDGEYQRIWAEGGYTMLTIDDMKWIDKNITHINL